MMNDDHIPSTSKRDELQEQFWICTYCTVENAVTKGKCSACDNYKGIRSERNKTLRAAAWDFVPAHPRERRPAPSRAGNPRNRAQKTSLATKKTVPVQKNIRAPSRASKSVPALLPVVPPPPPRKTTGGKVVSYKEETQSDEELQPPLKQVARKRTRIPSHKEELQSVDEPQPEVSRVKLPRYHKGYGKLRTQHSSRSLAATHTRSGHSRSTAEDTSESRSRSRPRRKVDPYAMDSQDNLTIPWPCTTFGFEPSKKTKKKQKVVSFDSNTDDRARNKFRYVEEDSVESAEIPLPIVTVNQLHKPAHEAYPTITWTSVSPLSPGKKSPVKKASKKRSRAFRRFGDVDAKISSPTKVRASTRSRMRGVDPAVQMMNYATDKHWKNLTARESNDTAGPRKARVDGHPGLSRGLEDSISPQKSHTVRSSYRSYVRSPHRFDERGDGGSLRHKRHRGGTTNFTGVSFEDKPKTSKSSASVPGFHGYAGVTRSPRLAAREVFKLVHEDPVGNSMESSSQEWTDDALHQNWGRKRRTHFPLEDDALGKTPKDGNNIKKDSHSRKKKSRPLTIATEQRKRRENVVPVEEPLSTAPGKRTLTASLMPKPEKIYKFESTVVKHGDLAVEFEEMVFSDYGFSSDEE